MESTESKFAHLLQPIKELTKNWEVDVASELNDYLEELDDMCITFDGGKTRLNFAEAALLIQGSACIYSKKVELLHSLVYQTLEYISDRNKRRNKEAAAGRKGDAGGAESSCDGEDGEFSPVDLEVSETSKMSDSTMTAYVTPLPPESLIPPETHEKHKLPLISVKGEVVCSQKDFRINLFFPGEEDLILLTLRSTAASRFLLDQHLVDSEDHQNHQQPDGAVENFLPIDDNMDLDQDQDPGQDQDQDPDPEEHVERHQLSAPSDGRMILDRRHVEAERRRQEEAELPLCVDIWTLHDPYHAVGEEKPFKPGKCYRVPDGLDGGKRKRKRAASLQDFRTWFRGTYDSPKRRLKTGPTFTDLNYIYLETLKDRVRTHRRIYRTAGVAASEDELLRTFLQPEEVGPEQGEEPMDGFQQADVFGGDGNSDNEQEAFPDQVPAELGEGGDLMSPENQMDGMTYEDLVKLRVDQLVVNSQGYTQETALSRRVKDWEDKIRPELLQQEERPAFNIHNYSERIVGALNAVGHCRTFASIVHGLDEMEVCKYLLASLQLANDYTVDINSAAGLEDSLDTMSLTLLSTHRATDRFKTLPGST
ncbi:condensin-2 complex subunit H2 [Melanotaenia boesemani]|uniref:condensin-2 complex subunit H2 n=1 Tax=Melanotaenia boesemani TaxID=1250792 RepID=UPI001C0410C6|nr:condensin-2 complex subunit H2 [Melanotaenia boesemani]